MLSLELRLQGKESDWKLLQKMYITKFLSFIQNHAKLITIPANKIATSNK